MLFLAINSNDNYNRYCVLAGRCLLNDSVFLLIAHCLCVLL